MKVQIDEDFTLESDSYSFMLRHIEAGKINSRTGEQVKKAVYSYHPSIKHALNHYLSESTKKSESVKEILAYLEEAEKKVDALSFLTRAQTRIG